MSHVTIDIPLEATLTVECEVAPFRPGRFTGPPEDCYPDEGGEVEVLSAKLDGTTLDGRTLDVLIVALGLSGRVKELATEAAVTDAAERRAEMRAEIGEP